MIALPVTDACPASRIINRFQGTSQTVDEPHVEGSAATPYATACHALDSVDVQPAARRDALDEDVVERLHLVTDGAALIGRKATRLTEEPRSVSHLDRVPADSEPTV